MTTRGIPAFAILALCTAVGLAAGWIYVSVSSGQGDETIPWNLTGMGGANSSAADMMVGDPLIVRVHVERWPVDVDDDSWLVQSVDQHPDLVTITLRPDSAHLLQRDGFITVGWYDTGGWVNVHLREPLPTCTTLRDGSTGSERHYCGATP